MCKSVKWRETRFVNITHAENHLSASAQIPNGQPLEAHPSAPNAHENRHIYVCRALNVPAHPCELRLQQVRAGV